MADPADIPDPTALDGTLAELDEIEFLTITYTEAEGLECDSNVDYHRALALLTRATFTVNQLIWRSEVFADELDEEEAGEDDDDEDDGPTAESA